MISFRINAFVYNTVKSLWFKITEVPTSRALMTNRRPKCLYFPPMNGRHGGMEHLLQKIYKLFSYMKYEESIKLKLSNFFVGEVKITNYSI
jgi:hypothetical protein